MQKRSHVLLARTLLPHMPHAVSRWQRYAFVFGSFQPDCNPFTHLRGSLRHRWFRGHSFPNAHTYVERHADRLAGQSRWNLRHYYTLGKLTHYVADAFTLPHNEAFRQSLAAHHAYERQLRSVFAREAHSFALRHVGTLAGSTAAIVQLHAQYRSAPSGHERDAQYILQANALLLAACRPALLQAG